MTRRRTPRTISFALSVRPDRADRLDLPAVDATFRLGEALGYRRGWLLHDGTAGSAVALITLLAGLSRGTSRLELAACAAVEGWNSPDAVAAALGTADLLAPGRVHAGVGARRSHPWAATTSGGGEFLGLPGAYHRTAARLVQVRKRLASAAAQGGSPDGGPRRRLWFPAADVASARWAAGEGLNLSCAGSVATGPGPDAAEQWAVVRAYREASGPRGTISVTRVLLPYDSADDDSRVRYAARAGRDPGVLAGSSCTVAERLAGDRAVRDADDLVVALPAGLAAGEQAQILHDVAVYVAPELGVDPGLEPGRAA